MQFLSRQQLEVCAHDQLSELEQELLAKHPHWQGTSRWGVVPPDSPHYGEFREIQDASPGGLMLRTAKDLQEDEANPGNISTSKTRLVSCTKGPLVALRASDLHVQQDCSCQSVGVVPIVADARTSIQCHLILKLCPASLRREHDTAVSMHILSHNRNFLAQKGIPK